jgi:hypothetical protein
VVDPLEELLQVDVHDDGVPDAIYACARSTA